ncbi:MAG: TCR/Tet family MFS transporter [Alphaproteobacteria bacterium]|nr:TCR/Tet family MFS transporter [Alphaproteobacteria bacterium]
MNPQPRVLPVLFATLLIDMIGFGMVFPIIPVLFTDPSSPSFVLDGYSKGMQFLMAGAVTALWGVTQFLAAPILGQLSDLYGRKRLLLTGVGVLGASHILFGIGVELGSLGLLLFARAIAGIAAGNTAIAQATIADVTAPKDRAKSFGLIGAAFGIGFILGPLLAGWIAGVSADPAMPFWVASALGLLNVAFLAVFLPETNPQHVVRQPFTLWRSARNIRAALEDAHIRPLYLASFLYLLGFGFLPPFYGVFLVNELGFSAAQVGMAFAAVGVCVSFAQLVVLRLLTPRYSERAIVRVSMLMVAFSMATFSFLPSVWMVMMMIPLTAIPQGLTMANMTAIISRAVPAERQGVALGINGSLMALGSALAPAIGGLGSAVFDIHTPFVMGAVSIGASWAVLFFVAPRRAAVPAS